MSGIPSTTTPSMPSGRSRLSDTGAIIVTHSRADLARNCAQRVLEEIEPQLVVVVVNDSANASAADLDWLKANVGDVVLNATLRGYGANVNEGARRLRGRCRYYLIMNDDVRLAPGSTAELRSFLESEPTIAVAAPLLVDVDGVPQPVTYRFPSIGSEVASALIVPARLQRRLWRRFVLGGDGDRAVWLVGAVLLVRASVFHELDGFDERFFLYSEETDLMFRMRQRGWHAVPCRDVVAVHLSAQSTAGRRYRRLMGVSRWMYVQKHWRRRRRIALEALLALAYLWNSFYVLVRILFDPSSLPAKRSLWAAHWENRTAPGSPALERCGCLGG